MENEDSKYLDFVKYLLKNKADIKARNMVRKLIMMVMMIRLTPRVLVSQCSLILFAGVCTEIQASGVRLDDDVSAGHNGKQDHCSMTFLQLTLANKMSM